MKSSKDIIYRDLGLTDFDEAWNFTENYFITREPLCSTLQLTPQEGYLFTGDLVKGGCSQGVSVGAFEQEHNKLVGYSINLIGTRTDDHTVPLNDENSPVKARQAQQAMRFALGIDLKETMGTTEYMEITMLCVHPQYTHRGIGSELCKRSMEIARANNVKRLFTMATSTYTKMIVKKLGFYEDHSGAYTEYVDPITKEKIFKNMVEPHKSMSRLVIDL